VANLLEGRESLAKDALNKAVVLIETLDDRYRESMLPLVFQYLISNSNEVVVSNANSQTQSEEEPTGIGPERKLQSNLSVNEFFKMADPKTQIDSVICAAYYLFHNKGIENFGYPELRDIFARLRIKGPQNLTDVVNKCIKSACIIEAPDSTNGQRQLVITPIGESLVEGLLEGATHGKK
jgi:hypothetical protein